MQARGRSVLAIRTKLQARRRVLERLLLVHAGRCTVPCFSERLGDSARTSAAVPTVIDASHACFVIRISVIDLYVLWVLLLSFDQVRRLRFCRCEWTCRMLFPDVETLLDSSFLIDIETRCVGHRFDDVFETKVSLFAYHLVFLGLNHQLLENLFQRMLLSICSVFTRHEQLHLLQAASLLRLLSALRAVVLSGRHCQALPLEDGLQLRRLLPLKVVFEQGLQDLLLLRNSCRILRLQPRQFVQLAPSSESPFQSHSIFLLQSLANVPKQRVVLQYSQYL